MLRAGSIVPFPAVSFTVLVQPFSLKHFLFLNRHYTRALRLSLNDLRPPPVCLDLGGIVYKSVLLFFFPCPSFYFHFVFLLAYI